MPINRMAFLKHFRRRTSLSTIGQRNCLGVLITLRHMELASADPRGSVSVTELRLLSSISRPRRTSLPIIGHRDCKGVSFQAFPLKFSMWPWHPLGHLATANKPQTVYASQPSSSVAWLPLCSKIMPGTMMFWTPHSSPHTRDGSVGLMVQSVIWWSALAIHLCIVGKRCIIVPGLVSLRYN